jgi:hypothetical protein
MREALRWIKALVASIVELVMGREVFLSPVIDVSFRCVFVIICEKKDKCRREDTNHRRNCKLLCVNDLMTQPRRNHLQTCYCLLLAFYAHMERDWSSHFIF